MSMRLLTENRLTLGVAVCVPLVLSVCAYIKKKRSEYKEFNQIVRPILITPKTINSYNDRPYMPFRFPHKQTMALCKLDMNYWGIVDSHYLKFLNERKKLLDDYDPEKLTTNEYFRTVPEFREDLTELMNFTIDHYCHRFPLLFVKHSSTVVENKITKEIIDITKFDPLLVVGKIMMEDMSIVQKKQDALYYCIGTSVTFGGGGFGIIPIINQPLDIIHKKVPYYESKLKNSMGKWFDRFEDPVERVSWHIVWDDDLNCNEFYSKARELSEEEYFNYIRTIPFEKFKVRLDRQTLIKLPKSKAVVFCNHPLFIDILREAKDEPMVPSIILKVMYEAPEDIIKYRHFEVVRDYLKPYLEEMINYQVEKGLIGKEEKVRTIPSYPFASWMNDLNWNLTSGYINPNF